MKSFWKMTLASALGVLVVSILMTLFTFGLVGTLAGVSNSVPTVPSNAILTINMENLVLGEQTLEEDPFQGMSISRSGVSQEDIATVGILDAVNALKAAQADPSIKMVYLRPDYARGIAHIEELRTALVDFRTSGKPVIAYIENPTNAGMYLGSVADRIYMADFTGGMSLFCGLSGRLIFYKDLLDKLGINIQLIRHGKYKSAGEGFIRNSASPENLMQNQVLLNSLWAQITSKIAERASITPDKLNSLIDGLCLSTAQDFVDAGLADQVVSMQSMKQILCEKMGEKNYNRLRSISLSDYAAAKLTTDYKIKEKIAVIYADGQIVDGRDFNEVAGKRFADIINDVREDNSIKAVVLRVNSPGGSVVASTQIKEAIDALKAQKPVVASYGEYAASGGYWISAGCEYIFSDATTLTGSIGVFGMIPDFSNALKNIAHVNITSVPTNKHSDMMSLVRPLDSDEAAFIQKDIESVYTKFTTLVAEGRGKTVQEVDDLGQGRVWAGADAIGIGLVDKIGGLKDAVEYAAEISGCAQYRVEGFPKPMNALDQMMEMFQKGSQPEDLVSIPGVSKGTIRTIKSLATMDKPEIMARMPYEISIR